MDSWFQDFFSIEEKRYYLVVIERLSIYMKAVANALQISNNAKRVLVQVKPMMHGSIQEEIESFSFIRRWNYNTSCI